jgi:hypothetical protein
LLARILTAFELVSTALGEVLTACLCTAAVGFPGLRSLTPGSAVILLRSTLVPVGGSTPVARVMLPLALAGLTFPLILLLVFLTVNVVVDIGIPVDVYVHVTSVPV